MLGRARISKKKGAGPSKWAQVKLKPIKKGSEEKNANAKRKPQPKQQKKGEGPRRGLKQLAEAPQQGVRAPRRHVRREVGVGMRLPAGHDKIVGEVAEQNFALDARVLCGTSHAEARVIIFERIFRSANKG